MFEGPEKKFQRHIADYLTQTHGYAVLKQSDITDPDAYIAGDHLMAFIRATQKQTFADLEKDYGTDAPDEILRTLKKELQTAPLWLIIRNGLRIRGREFKLYFPKPRSGQSAAAAHFFQNRFYLKDELVIQNGRRPDFVFFLNGLPIITLEVKHEKNQTVHDAVDQYAGRDHRDKIFQFPFLHIAADTSDVMVATDPGRAENFRWHNTGLANQAVTEDEYPVEFLYRDVLSPDAILEALSFYLIYVPRQDATDHHPEQPAFTIFPRYHQSRMVNKLSADLLNHFTGTGSIGRKYLIEHSAGSGKTLSICWLADRLHSLYDPVTNEKAVNMIFILTDRKSLDKNLRTDMEKLAHLAEVTAIAKKSKDLRRFITESREQIILTTQQKFTFILNEIRNNPALHQLRVAFLIDEAHRGQEGKTAVAVKVPFRDPNAEDRENSTVDPQTEMAEIIRAHDANQLFVAFTATPAPASVNLFGDPFDTYSEDEAIAEDYIVDVAQGIISYKTLFHLHCPIIPGITDESLYPKGIISKALKTVAFQDDGLIQYKAEVMLRIFEKSIRHLINGRAKAMIVATSRLAGLRYFTILKEKLRERGRNDKLLFAFSPFVDPATNKTFREAELNGLNPGEDIEDRFAGDDYRLMVVANKFLEGFDQPLLAGMFLDKAVVDRNAVQTVSRLNRCHEDKDTVVVVDFTNNAGAILKAFAKYRKGTPFVAEEPDQQRCVDLYQQILSRNIFSAQDAKKVTRLVAAGNDAPLQYAVHALRQRFRERLKDKEDRKAFVYLLARFVKIYYFMAQFFEFPEAIDHFAVFADYVGPLLIKQGSISDLMKQVRKTRVVKANVIYNGEVQAPGAVKIKKGRKGSPGPPLKKTTVQDVIAEIRERFTISDEEALIIREVTEEKIADPGILDTIQRHQKDEHYLRTTFTGQVDGLIQSAYAQRNRLEALWDPKYIDEGAIFDLMAFTVVENGIQTAARMSS